MLEPALNHPTGWRAKANPAQVQMWCGFEVLCQTLENVLLLLYHIVSTGLSWLGVGVGTGTEITFTLSLGGEFF